MEDVKKEVIKLADMLNEVMKGLRKIGRDIDKYQREVDNKEKHFESKIKQLFSDYITSE